MILKKSFTIQKIRKPFQNQKKEETDDYLTKLVRIVNEKEKHGYYDRNDPDYYGIRDIQNLFSKIDEEDYCKPISVKSSFKRSYINYERRVDKNKKLSVKQYL